MAITEYSILGTGTRVKVRRGRYPIEPALVGRTGTVVDASQYSPNRYGVVLDEESAVRYFAAGELEKTEQSYELPADRRDARQRLVRP